MVRQENLRGAGRCSVPRRNDCEGIARMRSDHARGRLTAGGGDLWPESEIFALGHTNGAHVQRSDAFGDAKWPNDKDGFDKVLAEQQRRLQRYLVTGSPGPE